MDLPEIVSNLQSGVILEDNEPPEEPGPTSGEPKVITTEDGEVIKTQSLEQVLSGQKKYVTIYKTFAAIRVNPEQWTPRRLADYGFDENGLLTKTFGRHIGIPSMITFASEVKQVYTSRRVVGAILRVGSEEFELMDAPPEAVDVRGKFADRALSSNVQVMIEVGDDSIPPIPSSGSMVFTTKALLRILLPKIRQGPRTKFAFLG